MQEPANFEVPSDTPLRGDYSGMAPDFTVAQDWPRYCEAEHARWRFLYARQAALLRRHAAPVFRNALSRLDAADGADGHHHAHDHQEVPSDLTLRTKALESLLVEKGLVHHVLHHGPVHHAQHFLRHRLGGGKETGAEAGNGKDCFANALHRLSHV